MRQLHKVLAAISFIGCMYFGTQLYVNFPAFAACYALCMWQVWYVMMGNEKPRGNGANRIDKYI